MKFLLGALVSLLLACSFTFAQPASSFASECRNAGPTDKTLSLGSQVDGKLFTVCASTFATRKISKRTNAKPSKPVPINRKVNPIGQVIFSYQRVGNSTRVSFKPTPPRAKRITRGQLSANQPIKFHIDNSVKLGASYLFGNRLGVRFTPIKVTVKISDGTAVQDFAPTHAFAASGSYRLQALVTYRVEYRKLVAGEYVNKKQARWVLDPGVITLASNPLTLIIGNTLSRQVVLVSQ